MAFKKLSSTYISRHKYFTAREDSYETSTGKIVDPYFVVELPTSACAMAITEDNKIILVSQYRYPVNEVFLELPGGFVDEGEQPHHAVARELLEETGYTFGSFQYLGITSANPGVLNNFTYLYLALEGIKTAEQKLDSNEEIEVILKPLEEVRMLLQQHGIRQSMHALCLFYGFDFLDKMKL